MKRTKQALRVRAQRRAQQAARLRSAGRSGTESERDAALRAPAAPVQGSELASNALAISASADVDRVACRIGDASCAGAHASLIDPSRGEATHASLQRLQRAFGNRYVGAVLGAARVGGYGVEQTLDPARAQQADAIRAARAVGPIRPAPAPSIQRTIGDGHDLQAPRFAGDPVLEACFDNERLLRVGASGDAVRKLQQALVDAGFALPVFGVDGKFGAETQTAVRDFQRSAGVGIDGIVGPQTMGALDARFAAPAPAPPGPAPAPVPVPPPAPPTLSADLQALVDANNSTYATYKTRITAASAAERATALADTTLLRNMQGVLARNDFAKVVELLGRSAPTAATMLADATVTAAMSAAFTASNPAVTLPPHNPAQPVGPCNPPAGTPPPAGVHEEGGWIYMNLITAALTTRRATAGGQASINLGGPPAVTDSIVVGTFHTHPNVGPCWGAVFPSGTDTNSANNTGVPWLIIGAFPDVATTQTTSTGPGRRAHLAGNAGFPGATGGDAPQATIDGTFDEV